MPMMNEGVQTMVQNEDHSQSALSKHESLVNQDLGLRILFSHLCDGNIEDEKWLDVVPTLAQKNMILHMNQQGLLLRLPEGDLSQLFTILPEKKSLNDEDFFIREEDASEEAVVRKNDSASKKSASPKEDVLKSFLKLNEHIEKTEKAQSLVRDAFIAKYRIAQRFEEAVLRYWSH